MTTTKPHVTIKGTKDGLVFHMDDSCSYQDLMLELEEKLDSSRHHFVDGPVTKVIIHMGYRYLPADLKLEMEELISSKGNLVVEHIVCNVVSVHDMSVVQKK